MKWHLNHKVHGARPWDVQAEAMRRSDDAARYGYFLEQGLGKTSLTVNDLVEYSDANLIDGMIVTVPNSFKLDWPLAPAEWGAPHVRAGYWPRDRLPVDWDVPFLYSINYEAVRQGARDGLLELMDKRRLMLTIDESTAIKNPQAQTTKAVIELAKRAAMVRELNGTPIVQNVMDYWGQLRVLGELNGTNPYAFRNRFAVMGGYMGKQITGMKNEEELYALLGRCSFRALTKDWRDLPPKIYVPVHLEMTWRQRRHYNEMMEDFFTTVGGLDVSADMVLTQMDKLRQISSCVVIQDGKYEFLEEPSKNPKMKAVYDIINGGPGKTIVVHFYKPSGRMLAEEFARTGLKPATIRGGMTPEQTIEEKRRFNDDSSCRVLVGQVDSTSRGHTLLGQKGNDRCNRMIFYENSFSRMHRAHMEDRNHRGDQDETCTVYDLSTSTMDDIAIGILANKKNMADAIDEIVATVRRRGWR